MLPIFDTAQWSVLNSKVKMEVKGSSPSQIEIQVTATKSNALAIIIPVWGQCYQTFYGRKLQVS
jgi:hypothetical protein